MSKILKINLNIIRIIQRKLYFISVLLLSLLVFLYLFSVNGTILNTSQRAQIEHESEILKYKIGELEFDLIARKNDLSLALAQSIGFKEAKEIKFISRKSVATLVNSLNIQ